MGPPSPRRNAEELRLRNLLLKLTQRMTEPKRKRRGEEIEKLRKPPLKSRMRAQLQKISPKRKREETERTLLPPLKRLSPTLGALRVETRHSVLPMRSLQLMMLLMPIKR